MMLHEDARDSLMVAWMRATDMYSPEGCPLALSRSQQQDLIAIASEMGPDRAEQLIEYAAENWDRINRKLADGRWPRSPRIALIRAYLDEIAKGAGFNRAFDPPVNGVAREQTG